MRAEYPKALYGPKGWGDLNDCVTVKDAEGEKIARAGGYGDLGEETVEPVDLTKTSKKPK